MNENKGLKAWNFVQVVFVRTNRLMVLPTVTLSFLDRWFTDGPISIYVTLHGKAGIKVIARSQHANKARLVCPKTRFMRISNS